MANPMLEVQGLKTWLHLRRGVVRAVDGVDLHVNERETLGIVGESGSGKSMTILSIMRLLPRQGGVSLHGRVMLDGRNLLEVPEQQMSRDYRGRKISMISQDPLTSLNPVFTVGDQVGAPLRYHGLARNRAAEREAVIDVLQRVRIPSPEQRLDDYPHQFSGGMRQRVVTAMAIACAPRLLVADEPTSALDVTIQVQMMSLFRKIQEETGVGIILITHDLGVAASICHRVAVMYAGRIVETADVRTMYQRPAHPYTQALPSLIDPPAGCRFAPRCPHRMPKCDEAYPPEVEIEPGHKVSCWLTPAP
ncbi:MAG TPA: ABC transporter ATP-binding protein [Burkholderiaceae bacterium]|nr:ABC transporter ATP-binding protein [Burkholderiaceae bacterium]